MLSMGQDGSFVDPTLVFPILGPWEPSLLGHISFMPPLAHSTTSGMHLLAGRHAALPRAPLLCPGPSSPHLDPVVWSQCRLDLAGSSSLLDLVCPGSHEVTSSLDPRGQQKYPWKWCPPQPLM